MPVNATVDYYKAESKFLSARSREEKIEALEDMIRLLPKHKGTENVLAQLRAKMAKLKKESEKRGGAKQHGIKKEGAAQVCLVGFTNSGKSTLLAKMTDARPAISANPFTTSKPVVGMMDYKGVKVQLVEIPSTLEQAYLSIARTSDCIVFVVRDESEKKELAEMTSYWNAKKIFANPRKEDLNSVKERIWKALELIVVYTKDKLSKVKYPMALDKGATVEDFAKNIHKDFIKNFHFARLWRSGMQKKVGLGFVLNDGDTVEIHTR